jgi:hypothetical protein
LLANKLFEFGITNMSELRLANKRLCKFLPQAAKNDRFLLSCHLISCKVRQVNALGGNRRRLFDNLTLKLAHILLFRLNWS